MGYASILGAIAPIFLLLFLGSGLRLTGRLTADADSSLMRLVVQVLYPALILRFVLGSPALDDPRNLFFAPAVGFGSILVGFAVAWFFGRLLGLKKGAGHRTFAFTGGIYNYGYIAIPVVSAVFADHEEAILAVLLIHNVGVEVAIWTAGVVLISGRFTREAWKQILNPPVFTLAVALGLSLSGLDRFVPEAVHTMIGFLANCAIPIGLLLAGATLADLLKERTSLVRPIPVPVGACIHRLALMPLAFIAAAIWLPGITTELRMVILVQGAMPAGIFPIVMSRHYGGHLLTAIQVVLATSVVSLLTTPFWIETGLSLFHK